MNNPTSDPFARILPAIACSTAARVSGGDWPTAGTSIVVGSLAELKARRRCILSTRLCGFESCPNLWRSRHPSHFPAGIMLCTDSMAADAYLSVDQAAEKLEIRLRRYHRRLKDKHTIDRGNGRAPDPADIDAPSYVIAAPGQEDDEADIAFNPVIIAESTTALAADGSIAQS